MRFTLNGEPCEVARSSVSYEDVARAVLLASPSVTYRTRAGGRGILHAGDRIIVTPDLTINAYATSDA